MMNDVILMHRFSFGKVRRALTDGQTAQFCFSSKNMFAGLVDGSHENSFLPILYYFINIRFAQTRAETEYIPIPTVNP